MSRKEKIVTVGFFFVFNRRVLAKSLFAVLLSAITASKNGMGSLSRLNAHFTK